VDNATQAFGLRPTKAAYIAKFADEESWQCWQPSSRSGYKRRLSYINSNRSGGAGLPPQTALMRGVGSLLRCNIRPSDGVDASIAKLPEDRNQDAKLGPKSPQRLTSKIYRVECVDTLCPLLGESAVVSEWARYPSIRTKAADGPCQNLARAILRSLSASAYWTTNAVDACRIATTSRQPLAAERTSHARSRDSRIAPHGCTRATHRRRSRT